MNHLNTIAARQTKSRLRDAMFVCFVAIATAMTVTSIGTAAAASVHVTQR